MIFFITTITTITIITIITTITIMENQECRSCIHDGVLSEPGINGSITTFFKIYPNKNLVFRKIDLFSYLSKEMYDEYKKHYNGIRTEKTLLNWIIRHHSHKNKTTLLEWYIKNHPSNDEIENYIRKNNSSEKETHQLCTYIQNKMQKACFNAVAKCFQKK